MRSLLRTGAERSRLSIEARKASCGGGAYGVSETGANKHYFFIDRHEGRWLKVEGSGV
jgi:hypothetical protein